MVGGEGASAPGHPLCFRVLGPIEVCNDRGPLALGGRQPRLLLAVLLSRAGTVCPPELLAEALWENTPPPAATSVLHSRVSRLRNLLEPARRAREPARVLQSRDDGYVLDLQGHDYDAQRFLEELNAGRDSLQSGDTNHAKAALEAALATWRGDAFGDLGSNSVLMVARAELEEQRVVTHELLYEARLRLGEHADLVSPLSTLVDAHPYRERFWEQLMLALYRAGRQAEALASYQRCRRQLIDELGIEPGTALRALDEAILLQASELDWRPARVKPTVASRCSRPPPAPRTSFVGRESEIDKLRDTLLAHRLVTVTGAGGVGKTRLALEVGHELGARFRHGVAFCDLVGLPGPERVEAAVADAIGARDPLSSGSDSLADHLAATETLLILDNADHAVKTVATLADRLLRACAQLRILVTSRAPLGAQGEYLMRLDPLAVDDVDDASVQLFAQRAQLAAPTANLELETVLSLCRRVDGLPLAIELAASRLRSVPLEHLVAGLDDRLSTLAGSSAPVGTTPHGTLRDVVQWSIDLLDDDERALLRRLAVFAGGCTAEAASAVCGIGGDPIEALARLVDRSLVQIERTSPERHRYRLLETIRADGLARLAEHDELDDLRRRHLAWCRALAPSAAEVTYGEDADALTGIGAEIDNVVAALSWSLAGGDAPAGTALAIACAPWWVHAGRFVEARTWLEFAALATPVPPPLHHRCLRCLGWVLARQGDLAAARRVLGHAVEAPRDSAPLDVELVVDAELSLAKVEIAMGDLAAGESRLRAWSDSEAVQGVSHRRALVHHAYGIRAQFAGELPEAAAHFERAAEEARDARMWLTLVQSLTSLTQAEAARRRFTRAQGAMNEALSIARGRRLLGEMPALLGAAGILAYTRGDWSNARAHFAEALAAARHVGDRHAEVATLTNLGAISQNEGRHAEAVELLTEALDLANRSNDDRTALVITTNLAEAVLAANHDTRRALALSLDAIARARDTGVRIAVALGVESAAYALAERNEPGDLQHAAELIGAAAAEREALERPDDAGPNSPIERALACARRDLGATLTEAAVARGRAVGVDRSADDLLRANTIARS